MPSISHLSSLIKLLIRFAKYLWHVCTSRVAFEKVASVELGACAAAAADLAVLAHSALAFDVALVPQLQVQRGALQFVPGSF